MKQFIIGLCVISLCSLSGVPRAEMESDSTFLKAVAESAVERTNHPVRYDGSYQRIPYPMGDVPKSQGVCTDVIIRSYRAIGIDLQQLVHEDMAQNFSAYPKHWGLQRPDTNIDHRRVPNLATFFTRFGETLPHVKIPEQYQAGDIVTWILPGNLPHIGIVSNVMVQGTQRRKIVHNIGQGPQLEDRLFDFPITGHFRFIPRSVNDQ